MKILMLHNSYKIQGGEDVSTEAEVALLRRNGVEVDTLFINNNSIETGNKFSLALNTIWAEKYYKEVLDKLNTKDYDLLHVQNLFPLFSPSIFYAAKKAGIKVVMSVRNYRLVCPNALMYVKDSICTSCVGKKIPYPAFFKKCYRDSLGASLVTGTMLGTHNLLNTWNNKIDGFICISEFVKNQLLKVKFRESQLHVKHNFVYSELPPNFNPGEYYLFVGRLSTEKGIDILLEAFSDKKRRLVIIGDGPLKKNVVDASEKNPLIEYLGKLPLKETYEKIALAKGLIFPSKWHEPFGRTIVESFAHGTPVIGSALGGISELIQNGYNGYLFDPYKQDSLFNTLETFESATAEESVKMRENSYTSYTAHFDPQSNFHQLMSIYTSILEKE